MFVAVVRISEEETESVLSKLSVFHDLKKPIEKDTPDTPDTVTLKKNRIEDNGSILKQRSCHLYIYSRKPKCFFLS